MLNYNNSIKISRPDRFLNSVRHKIVVISLTITLSGFSQSVPNKFSQLSAPIKTWVLLHPFKAKKAQQISIEANRVSDSIKKSNVLDGNASGGQVDAFRHGYWMARLHQEIGKSAAKSLGKAHEKENKLMFEKRKSEDEILPDQPSKKMDLFNNEIGLSLISKDSKTPKSGLLFRVINSVLAGEMKIIKKDKKGNFLRCDGTQIVASELNGKWENEKCLVSSNQSIE